VHCHRKSLARGAGVVALLVALTAARAGDSSQADAALSLPAPLDGDAFAAAVLAHNASLEAMQQAVVAAVAQIKPAGALDDPMLSVSAAPRTFGSATGASGDIEISQSLPWWGTLDARKEAARAQAEAAGQDFDALRVSVAALARGAFSDWAYVHRALDINEANQAVLTEMRDAARVRYSTGEAPQEDVLQADVERSMLKQQRLELTRDEASVQARMNALLDRRPRESIPAPAALPATKLLPAEELLAQRALSHPQLQKLAADERAATAQERLAEKDRYPKFGVSAGYNNLWSDPNQRPMVGLSFTVPIDQSKYRARIDAARAEAHRAASMLEDERASLLADLSAAYASAREAAESIALYQEELLPLARNTLAVARAEYANGRGDFLNVLTADRHRLETELALARMESDYYQRLAELDRMSGGGLIAPRSKDTGAVQ